MEQFLHDLFDVFVWGHGENVFQDADIGAETSQGGHAMDGHHAINLPAGPLYGRIRVRAWSMFDISPTEYLNAKHVRDLMYCIRLLWDAFLNLQNNQ